MSNKYLEKAASLFPSMAYKKTLSEKEKQNYALKYNTAGSSHIGKTLLTVAAAGIGAGLGHHAGATLGGKVGAKLGSNQGKKTGMRMYNLMKMTGESEREARGAAVFVHNMHKRNGQIDGRIFGGLAGGVAGSIPAASYGDNWRHNHAKSVIEKKRNQND